MDKNTMKKRISTVAGKLKEQHLDGALITDRANVSYLTGFLGDDSFALIIGRRVWLLTDSRYTEQAQGECVGCKIIERKDSLPKEVAKIVDRFKSARILGIENTTSLMLFDTIRKNIKPKLKKTPSFVRKVRAIKEPGEIAILRKANNIADRALAQALKRIRVGIPEAELAGIIELEMRKLGALAAFETIVCFGANASRPHHSPGKRKLRKNDTILIDFGANYKGYNSDKTRCFAVGKTRPEFKRAYNAVALSQKAAIELITDGVRCRDVDATARKIIEESGFPVFGHGLGHGIGLEAHEQPALYQKSKGKLKAGQVITIEPGIYIPGQFGVRIEDDILVTKAGSQIISRTKTGLPLRGIKCK
jgi:Xaa-Pro aminopeptidase